MLNKTAILGYILLILSISSFTMAADNADIDIVGGSTMGIRSLTPHDIEISLNAALKEVIQPNTKPVKIIIYPSTQALYAAFDKREIHGIFGTSLEFLGRENQLVNQKITLGEHEKARKQRLLLITRKDLAITQLADLKNKRLTLSKSQDLEALYLNMLLLKNHQPEIPNFFAKQLDSKSANFAIMSVFFNNSDAAIVYEYEYHTAIELNPQIGKKTVILESSPLYLTMVGAARKGYSDERIEEFAKLFKNMSITEKGKKVLGLVNASSLELAADNDIQSVRDLLQEYETLKKPELAKHSQTNISAKHQAQ